MKTPNFVANLTPSYNTRGVDLQTNIVAGLDQRKVNSFYEIVENKLSNTSEAFLTKRPGATTVFSGGTSYQITSPYLIGWSGGSGATPYNVLVVGHNSTDLVVSENFGVTNTTLISSATEWPVYTDRFVFGNTYYSLVQCHSNSNNAQRVFYSSSVGSWSEITDTDFTSLYHYGKMEFIDGFAFILDINNKIFQSDLNSISSWGASNYIQKLIMSDYPQGLARLKNQLLAFGSESVEVFYNVGNTTGTVLGRLPHLHAKIGLADGSFPRVDGKTHYYCVLNDKLYFIGREAGRSPQSGGYSANAALFVFDGSRFERIESAGLSKLLSSHVIYGVYSVQFQGQVAVGIQLTSPTSATETVHRWIMFFPNNNSWFEWTSTRFMPTNNGNVFLGTKDNPDDTFYFGNVESFQDGSSGDYTNYEWLVQFEIPNGRGLWRSIPYCGVDGDTARSATSLTISKTTDDYQNWVDVGTIDMTRNRKCKYGLGTFSNLSLRLSYTGANPVRIQNFYATIDE